MRTKLTRESSLFDPRSRLFLWIRALIKFGVRGVDNALFGLGLLDYVFLLGVFSVGAYAPYDMFLNLLVAGFSSFSFASKALSRRRAAATVLACLSAVVIVTGAVIPFDAKFSLLDCRLRQLHLYSGRFFVLSFVPYLFFHLRSPWQNQRVFRQLYFSEN